MRDGVVYLDELECDLLLKLRVNEQKNLDVACLAHRAIVRPN
jgi:hypothetical protein